MDVDAPWLAFWTIISAAVLEVADQFLLLRVHRDDRLLPDLRGDNFRVDVFELGIAVGMVRSFIGLAIGLAREAELHQFLAHRIRSDRMSHLGQRRGEFVQAFRHPDQRPHRIAKRRRLHEALKCGNEPRIGVAKRATSTAGAANAPLQQRLRVEIIFAAIDCRTGEPGDLRDHREAAPPGGPRLRRHKQPPSALVELCAHRLPSLPNCVRIDHAADLRRFVAHRNPQARVTPSQVRASRFS